MLFFSSPEFPVEKPALPYAMPRRHATDAMLARQGSFRGFPGLHTQSPFKRQLSLRLNDLPSTLQRQQQVLQTHTESKYIQEGNGKLWEGPVNIYTVIKLLVDKLYLIVGFLIIK